jgi:hypothetical protein
MRNPKIKVFWETGISDSEESAASIFRVKKCRILEDRNIHCRNNFKSHEMVNFDFTIPLWTAVWTRTRKLINIMTYKMYNLPVCKIRDLKWTVIGD